MARTKSLIEGFWDRINEVIDNQGLSKAELARRIGCDRKSLYDRDRALNTLYLARFCAVTNADANYLLGVKREPANKSDWIDADYEQPKNDKYILLSFANFPVAEVGRYETDKDGGGNFYIGDDDKSCLSYGLIVNGWMPLPECMED